MDRCRVHEVEPRESCERDTRDFIFDRVGQRNHIGSRWRDRRGEERGRKREEGERRRRAVSVEKERAGAHCRYEGL